MPCFDNLNLEKEWRKPLIKQCAPDAGVAGFVLFMGSEPKTSNPHHAFGG